MAWFRYGMSYQYAYPVLTSLEITVEDLASGELLSRFAWSGMSWTAKRGALARAFRKLDQDLGLAPAAAR